MGIIYGTSNANGTWEFDTCTGFDRINVRSVPECQGVPFFLPSNTAILIYYPATNELLTTKKINIFDGQNVTSREAIVLVHNTIHTCMEVLQSMYAKSKQRISQREREVLLALAAGLVQKEIAEKLFIAQCTVNTHVQHIYAKLEVRNAVSAVVQALKRGVIDLLDLNEEENEENYP